MILDFLLAIIVFAFVITIVITVHELGHFLAAKITKTKVTEFVIGFPPFIFKKQIGETLFGIGAIPFGGYNKIYGESETAEDVKDPKSFTSKTTAQKLFIIISGVIGNFILSAFIFYIILFSSNFSAEIGLLNQDYKFPLGHQESYLLIGAIEENSPAFLGGIKPNELLLDINNQRIQDPSELSSLLNKTKEQEILVKTRNRETNQINTYHLQNETGLIGIGYTAITEVSYRSLKDKVFSGVFHTYNFADYSLSTLGNIIGKSVKEKDLSIAGNAVAGPVGIFAITKISMKEGFMHMLNLIAIISLALGITNMLPIPALDGGKCVYLLFQKINPKFFTDELSEKIDGIGFLLLIFLGVLIIIKDVFQFKDLIF